MKTNFGWFLRPFSLFLPFLEHFWSKKKRVKRTQNRARMGQNGVFLGDFVPFGMFRGVTFGSIWHRFGIVWHHFRPALRWFWPHFGVFLWAIRWAIFGPFCAFLGVCFYGLFVDFWRCIETSNTKKDTKLGSIMHKFAIFRQNLLKKIC